jgi:hypothetical protein
MEIVNWVSVTITAIAIVIIFVGAAYQERLDEAQAELDDNLSSKR